MVVKPNLSLGKLPIDGQLGTYGPPPCRKRKVRVTGGLRKCIRPLLEWITPGQDGMRCALFPFNDSVLRARGSTVVPSHWFASRPGTNSETPLSSLG
jgi:hypothetical protein